MPIVEEISQEHKNPHASNEGDVFWSALGSFSEWAPILNVFERESSEEIQESVLRPNQQHVSRILECCVLPSTSVTPD